MPNWTKEQEAAIASRDRNLLVAAAAGSGKTAVLVERIIQLILKDRVDIDKLLIVTFTHAAAGEMRERISSEIIKHLEEKKGDEGHLRRQLNLLNRSTISTLHSFCIDVVRRYFYLIDVDPNFRIGDETETMLMKLEGIEELFEAEYEKAAEEFLGLVEMFGASRDDASLKNLVLRTYEFIQSKPHPMKWLKERVEDFNVDEEKFSQSPWVQTILQQVQLELSGAKENFAEALSIAQQPGGPEGYQEAIAHDLEIVEELMEAARQGLTPLYDRLSRIDHIKLGRVSKDVDEALKEEAKELRDEGKKVLKGIQGEIIAKSPEECLTELHQLYPYMKYLFAMVKDFAARYQEKKSERGIVDFNDLEHYSLNILAHKEVAAEYRNRFAYIFVDEYQDSNLVQETILNYIRRENNLFLVGDVKQSIYRFRLADPELFIEKFATFADERNIYDQRIDLNKNFRSREEIIHGVNFIFKQIMSRHLGEIDYDANSYLYKGAETQEIEDPAIELCIIDKNAEIAELEVEIEELENMEVEARVIAKRIKGLLGREIYDHKLKTYRKVEYRDIVVLLRTTQNWARAFMETFLAEGIPAYADVNTGYFEALEINILMNLLRVIDNKRQDIPLLSVMRSPICRFTLDELIKIRVESQAPTYFSAIEEYMERNEDELAGKIREFINKLNAYKNEARFMRVDDFIYKLLMDTGYYYYVGAMPGGSQRQANLRILLDRAKQFQSTSMKGLFNFIKFVDKLNAGAGDMGEAKILGEKDNVVRIMSIHKSKGLEFPVVIVGGLGKQFNLSDTNASVLFHKDLGIGPKYVNTELRVYGETIAKTAMKNKIKIESLSEEMRVLYVACTRPKDKLILVGSVRDLEKHVKKWRKTIGPYNLAKGKSYLDWIGPVVMRHPHGEKLRELVRIPPKELYLEDPSTWRVEVVNRSHINLEELEKKKVKKEFSKMLREYKPKKESPTQQEVAERLNWEYAYMDAVKIPSKLSVTQIKRLKAKELDSAGINIPPLTTRPKFLEGVRAFTGAEKGSIMHFVMQHLDLAKVNSKEEIREQLARMVENELLKEEEAAVVEVGKIADFFCSPLGQRVLKAERVYREVPFNLVRKACEVIDGLEGCEEGMLIQGVIDLYFKEEDGLVLVDYKTDYIFGGNHKEIVEKYREQLENYKYALESISGKKVKESYLYLLDTGEEVKL